MQAATGGVGLVISNKTRRALIGIHRISNRILKANFEGNPTLTVIVAYAPCEHAESADKDDFYDKLREAIETVPQHNFLTILGDFNARLGPADVRFTCSKQTNDNGKMLLDIMEEYQLLACNTLFQKRAGKLWTWKSPNSTVHQIDFILTRKKWGRSITNCEAYGSFSSLGSDHRIITAMITLSLRAPKAKARKEKFMWNELANDRELQARYAVEVRNKFQILQLEGGNATENYQNFVDANQQAAESCLTKVTKKKGRRELCLDHRVSDARAEVKRAYSTLQSDKGDNKTNQEMYANKKETLYSTYNDLEQEDLEEKISQVEAAHESHKYGLSWQLINSISGRKSCQTAKIHVENGETRQQAWLSHFSNLLGDPPQLLADEEAIHTIFPNLLIDDSPFTMVEYKKAVASLKCHKASGEDGIAPEVLKYVPLDDIILEFINNAYSNGETPEQWSTLNIIPVPKSGDLSQPDNYRGISLSSVVSKTYNRMLLNRIRPVLDPLLRHSQNGFRQNRSTVGQILALRRLLEGVRDHALAAVITFIDFRKAFDSIHRGRLIEILHAYGVPDKLVQAIGASYARTRAKVCSPDGETDYFDISAGVLQGDTLAPFLFIVALDYALRCAIDGREEELGFTLVPRRSRRVHPVVATDLDFADDIALLSDTASKASDLLLATERECRKIGLHLNSKKTKVMALNIPDATFLSMNNDEVEKVSDFKYLGSWVSSTEQDIKVRRALAWNALHKMSKVWKSTLRDDLKRRLFVATVESVLVYGAESWTLTVKQEKALDGLYTRLLRLALNVTWRDHVRNTDLYANLPKLSTKLRARRLRLAGHCVRHPELPASSFILWEPPHGGRGRRGRKQTNYISMLKRDTGLDSIEELRTAMLDRITWRGYIRDARVGVG